MIELLAPRLSDTMSEASKNLIDCRSSIDLALVRIWAAVVSIQLTCKYFNACSYKFKKI